MTRAKKVMEATTDPLNAMLARLQLSGIRDQLDSLLDEAARANLSARETLILLCEREIARKPRADHPRRHLPAPRHTKSRLSKPPAAYGPPVRSASLRPVSGGANLQSTT